MAHETHAEPLTGEIASRELLGGRGRMGSPAAIGILAILALLGLGALISLIASGPEPYFKWGYTAGTLGFLVSTFQAMPIVAFATRLARGYWALPMRRAAE